MVEVLGSWAPVADCVAPVGEDADSSVFVVEVACPSWWCLGVAVVGVAGWGSACVAGSEGSAGHLFLRDAAGVGVWGCVCRGSVLTALVCVGCQVF